jgi:predicted ATPase
LHEEGNRPNRLSRVLPCILRHCGAAAVERTTEDILGLVYSWFTEGFDTADLQEARALLVEQA